MSVNLPMIRLYESGEYSDLTVVCGRDVYNVHKAIVCPRSEFFSKACRDGRWKVLHLLPKRRTEIADLSRRKAKQVG